MSVLAFNVCKSFSLVTLECITNMYVTQLINTCAYMKDKERHRGKHEYYTLVIYMPKYGLSLNLWDFVKIREYWTSGL